jgi:prepilin-type N-terminal cleavage/methylation domain-containing protein/prepilin-type processing-associated H-X9-DG protein
MPNHDRSQPQGFTLVELLVVIAIIAVLISVLLPALARAREAANALACASNMRQIGQAVMMFADSHGGRAPGTAYYVNGNPGNGPSAKNDLSWHELLNKEQFKVDNDVPRLAFSTPNYPGKSLGNFYQFADCKLYCPTSLLVSQPASASNRCYAMNLYVNGGKNTGWGVQYPAWGQYGRAVTPPSMIDQYYTFYYQGAKLTIFQHPAEKYLVVESDRATDTVFDVTTDDVLGGDAGYTPYDGGGSPTGGGVIAYRHNLHANILFIDGHVEARDFDKRERDLKYLTPDS